MTTSPMHTQSGVSGTDMSAQARAAVKAFRAMQPGLSSFARHLTGRREVRVELAAGGPRTDGTKIYYRPPIALGSGARHDRLRCDRRDADTQLQQCPACRVREEVMIQVYHEISHIAFGSFKAASEQDKTELLQRALSEYPGRFADQIKKRVEDTPAIYRDNYMAMAGIISPFLPQLLNALEDVRIDNAMFKARKGTKAMFDAMTTQIFRTGIETDLPGEFAMWDTQPLNAQVIVGVFCLGSEYDYEGWFSPSVEAALADEKLRSLVSEAVTSKTNGEVYRKSFPILARLRDLGFCMNDYEEDEEEDDAGDDDTADDGSSDDRSSEDDVDTDQEDSDEGDPSENEEVEDADDSESGDDDDSGPEGTGEDGAASGDEASGDSEDSGTEDSESEQADEQDAESGEGEGSPSGDAGPGEDGPESDEDADSGEPADSPSSGDTDTQGEAGGDQVDDEEDSHGGSDPQREGHQDDSDSSGTGDPQSGGGLPGEAEGDEDEAGAPTNPEVKNPEGVPEPAESEDAGDGSPDEGEQSDELIDSGADEGKGGKESDIKPEPHHGTAEDTLGKVEVFGHHSEVHVMEDGPDSPEQSAVDVAIIQGLYFEQPSGSVGDVKIWRMGDEKGDTGYFCWEYADEYLGRPLHPNEEINLQSRGARVELDIPESILGPATLQTRRTFDDNMRARRDKNMKSGKIRGGSLARRAPFGDERLFGKKVIPGKKSYSVLIGIDVSGSTIGQNLVLAKKAAYAQAELCQRVGIDFAVYAHTTGHSYEWSAQFPDHEYRMDMYEIKSFDDEWNTDRKRHLAQIKEGGGNLDGHSIEFYRKTVERRPTTDKIILYYSDGKMPAANHNEELDVLQTEISYCRSRGITLMGVGIRTDSPARHGLDTVQIDSEEGLADVVKHLGKRINMTR